MAESDSNESKWVSRRRVLAVGGLSAAAVGLGTAGLGRARSALATSETAGVTSATSAASVCVLSPEVTEGPYYLADSLIRRDITEGKAGLQLILDVQVVDTTSDCKPLDDVAVEIWHCDAWGYYSGYTDKSPGGEVPPYDNVGDPNTNLRGYQITNPNGRVRFQTIVPGWYSPRVTHIHCKVHTGGSIEKIDGGKTYEGGKTVHTGQFLFPDDICEAYSVVEPYSQHKLQLTTLTSDQVYNEALQSGGNPATMVPAFKQLQEDSVTAGYKATIVVGVDPSATSVGGTPPTGTPPTGGPSPSPTS
jgi:protocatechuate 3,4-dioxygenase beta subunit